MTTEVSIAQKAAAGERDSRQVRAERLFRKGAFERVRPHVWIVENPERKSVHNVDLAEGTCDCEDHSRHAHIPEFSCYHRTATEMYVGWLKDAARDLAPVYFRNTA